MRITSGKVYLFGAALLNVGMYYAPTAIPVMLIVDGCLGLLAAFGVFMAEQ